MRLALSAGAAFVCGEMDQTRECVPPTPSAEIREQYGCI